MKKIVDKTIRNLNFSFIILLILTSLACRHKSTDTDYNYDPVTKGYVPNEETAIRIAEAVWLPIYGTDVLDEKPFIAKLSGNVWTVFGTLHANHGGTAFIKLQKSDGRIISIGHQK
ncbi:NTF2 fold immunity protein [Mucilaginibacter angelicae]|uniref:NTF2 fold immunity protein n=1 Tax=Mucilaginibacter angelicae TaxID=869718 RepID=A0ABV6L8G1_9SPHI